MAITFKSGNIFETKMQTIVIPVNCMGTLGKGLALQFKSKYPHLYKKEKIKIGCPLIIKSSKWFILFPSKEHWKDPSKLDYIELGMFSLSDMVSEEKIESIAIPALGCGLGGLIGISLSQ